MNRLSLTANIHVIFLSEKLRTKVTYDCRHSIYFATYRPLEVLIMHDLRRIIERNVYRTINKVSII